MGYLYLFLLYISTDIMCKYSTRTMRRGSRPRPQEVVPSVCCLRWVFLCTKPKAVCEPYCLSPVTSLSSLSLCANYDVIQKKRKYVTYHCAPEEDRATAKGDMRKKFGEDRACSTVDMIVDRETHTDRQTRSSQYSAPPSGTE